MKYQMKDMPEEERPYEKCIRQGACTLTDSELLAVIMRTGAQGKSSLILANEVLQLCKRVSNGLPGLYHLSVSELMQIKGIGKVKAIQLLCIGELSRRLAQTAARESLSFREPSTIARYYMEQLRHEEQEVLICMMLDSKNHFLRDITISRGTVNASLISPRELFLEALRHQAVNIILIHNHPSGDPTPSREDAQVTRRVYEAGELIGIHLLDHIVIGDHQYVSFCEQKQM